MPALLKIRVDMLARLRESDGNTGSWPMIFESNDIQVMRAALTTAERSLSFAYPQGLDLEVRMTLAKAIVQAMSAGQLNPGFLSYIALSKLDPKRAAPNAT
jgi:hypothetical protein